jgi:glycosyltransferase involved in cell wall biosynthesis
MSMVRTLFLFGSLLPPHLVASYPEASEGPNWFQLSLLQGMVQAGLKEAVAVTALPIRAVPIPRAPIVRTQRWRLDDSIRVIVPGFLNLPPGKPLLVHASLRHAALDLAPDVRPDVVVAYNPAAGSGSAALATARRLGVPFVCIVADLDRPDTQSSLLRKYQARWAERVAGQADGMITVSGHTPRDLGTTCPWIKLDGGLAPGWEVLPEVGVRTKTVVFTGRANRASGIMLLVAALRHIPDPDIRLIISGRGGLEREIRQAARSDPRINIAGFLDRQQWRNLLASATALVNPRLSDQLENRYNFPSKLIEYLAAGRPVITTLSGDLDPEYLDVTIPLLEETPGGLAALMQKTLDRPADEMADLGARGREFVLREKTWGRQAKRVHEFIGSLI